VKYNDWTFFYFLIYHNKLITINPLHLKFDSFNLFIYDYEMNNDDHNHNSVDGFIFSDNNHII